MVRESQWAAIRESEKSTIETLRGVFQEAIFSPEVMYSDHPPLTVTGNHPAKMRIEHKLPDGTWLLMHIECHGFNNEQAEGRLRSREYLGVIIPEMQTVPFNIITIASERAGRWRQRDVMIQKEVDGQVRTLSGVMALKMVFCDENIPARPHPVYDHIYDVADHSKSRFLVVTPPPPIIPVPKEVLVERKGAQETEKLAQKYRETIFEKKRVIWMPNPKAYQMTKHYEEVVTDELGNVVTEEDGITPKTVPYSGYKYWLSMLDNTESYIRRMVIGKPDNVGGAASVYKNFNAATQIRERGVDRNRKLWIGQDPGKYAAFYFLQEMADGSIHVFKEFFFQPEDALLTRRQLEDYVFPELDRWIEVYGITDYAFVVDPSAEWGTASGEGAIAIIAENGYYSEPFATSNQDVALRRDGLGYYLEQDLLTIDPSCVYLIQGLKGAYQYKKSKAGVVSDIIEKNEFSHCVEALQYPVGNIYYRDFVLEPSSSSSSLRGVLKARG